MNINSSEIKARGVLFIHSAPKSLAPHLEWLLSDILKKTIKMNWLAQKVLDNSVRAELSWEAIQGTGAKIASALRGWDHLRYEITEEPSLGADGSRWSFTPSLGIFYARMDVHGNVLVPEEQIKAAIENMADAKDLLQKLNLALGTAWDSELEPFRVAGENSNISWLHQV